MASGGRAADGRQQPPSQQAFATGASSGQFDIFDWHPAYLSCQRFFLQHAQYENSVQAVCALVNIRLPFQSQASEPSSNAPNWVSIVPYVRRLVVTGFDKEAVLHGFFGNDWLKGIGPVQECERRNYLFAAKSGGWLSVKAHYDMGPHETVPFLQPPQNIDLAEIENAERLWSQWLATEDWMVGPRAPEDGTEEYTRERGQR